VQPIPSFTAGHCGQPQWRVSIHAIHLSRMHLLFCKMLCSMCAFIFVGHIEPPFNAFSCSSLTNICRSGRRQHLVRASRLSRSATCSLWLIMCHGGTSCILPCDYLPQPMFQMPESWAITHRIFVHLGAAVQHVFPEP